MTDSDAATGAAADELVLTRDFDAPRELVWKAWTEPERLMRWWGPKGLTMRTVTVDLRPGGLFLYSMRTPDGEEMWGRFVYREIEAPRRLVFVTSFSNEQGGITRHPWSPTWPLEVLTTLTLTEQNGRTTLALQGRPINASDVERQTFEAERGSVQQGFAGTFDQLAEYFAAQAGGR